MVWIRSRILEIWVGWMDETVSLVVVVSRDSVAAIDDPIPGSQDHHSSSHDRHQHHLSISRVIAVLQCSEGLDRCYRRRDDSNHVNSTTASGMSRPTFSSVIIWSVWSCGRSTDDNSETCGTLLACADEVEFSGSHRSHRSHMASRSPDEMSTYIAAAAAAIATCRQVSTFPVTPFPAVHANVGTPTPPSEFRCQPVFVNIRLDSTYAGQDRCSFQGR